MPTERDQSTFLRQLEAGISKTRIEPNDSIICAISGGIDSTALLLGLIHLPNRYKSLTAAHYNHRARGNDSEQDEQFVRDLCTQLDIPLIVGRADHGTDRLDENTARRLRYKFLTETAERIDADAVAVAHTTDDQAETILLRLARGAGIRGVGGMTHRRSIKITTSRNVVVVRPMLQIARHQADRFLNALHITARHDDSNDDWSRYARNRIRHRVIPELETLNPQAVSAIVRFAEIMQSNTDLIDKLADQALHHASTGHPNTLLRIPVADSHSIVAAEVLAKMYRNSAEPETQLEQTHIDKMLNLLSIGKSASYNLPDEVVFWTDHRHIGMARAADRANDIVPYPDAIAQPITLPLPGQADLGNGYTITSDISTPPNEFHGTASDEAWLNRDELSTGSLFIRNRKESDRFHPLGMSNDVDLSDFLINSKIAASWRDRIPIVVSPAGGQIVWLPGIRIADWAKLTARNSTAVHLTFRRNLVPSIED
ncbi:MAG: tRNA lysidine(34) synthetase TilS [Chloroflexi bacterium]|nr:tRNA lysidine(34) synthetase TilS [Chloroflexota bacterium]